MKQDRDGFRDHRDRLAAELATAEESLVRADAERDALRRHISDIAYRTGRMTGLLMVERDSLFAAALDQVTAQSNTIATLAGSLDTIRAALLEQGTTNSEGECWCCCGHAGVFDPARQGHTDYCLRAQRALGLIP